MNPVALCELERQEIILDVADREPRQARILGDAEVHMDDKVAHLELLERGDRGGLVHLLAAGAAHRLSEQLTLGDDRQRPGGRHKPLERIAHQHLEVGRGRKLNLEQGVARGDRLHLAFLAPKHLGHPRSSRPRRADNHHAAHPIAPAVHHRQRSRDGTFIVAARLARPLHLVHIEAGKGQLFRGRERCIARAHLDLKSPCAEALDELLAAQKILRRLEDNAALLTLPSPLTLPRLHQPCMLEEEIRRVDEHNGCLLRDARGERLERLREGRLDGLDAKVALLALQLAQQCRDLVRRRSQTVRKRPQPAPRNLQPLLG